MPIRSCGGATPQRAPGTGRTHRLWQFRSRVRMARARDALGKGRQRHDVRRLTGAFSCQNFLRISRKRAPGVSAQIHETGAHRRYKSAPSNGPRVVWPWVSIEAAMKQRKKNGRRIGQPAVECPKCQKVVLLPERLVVHFNGCSSVRRSSVLKPGPMYRMPDGR
jgi:hypothetical protein